MAAYAENCNSAGTIWMHRGATWAQLLAVSAMVTCSVVYAVSSWYAVCGLQAQIDLDIVSASACRMCRMLLHWMLAAQLVRARLDWRHAPLYPCLFQTHKMLC